MIKTKKIKAKRIENDEIIMAMTMTKTIITKVIIITKMRMNIRIGNRIKNETLKKKKSVQVKAIHICLKGRNVQKAMFYWNAKTTCRWFSLSL